MSIEQRQSLLRYQDPLFPVIEGFTNLGIIFFTSPDKAKRFKSQVSAHELMPVDVANLASYLRTEAAKLVFDGRPIKEPSVILNPSVKEEVVRFDGIWRLEELVKQLEEGRAETAWKAETGQLRSFLKQFDKPLLLTNRLDNMKGEFNQQHINEIILWSLNASMAFSEAELNSLNQLQELRPGEHKDATVFLTNLLRKENALPLPILTAIFRFRNPDVFQVMNPFAYKALYGKSWDLDTKNPVDQAMSYMEYLTELRHFSEEKEFPFDQTDRMLEEFYRRKNIFAT